MAPLIRLLFLALDKIGSQACRETALQASLPRTSVILLLTFRHRTSRRRTRYRLAERRRQRQQRHQRQLRGLRLRQGESRAQGLVPRRRLGREVLINTGLSDRNLNGNSRANLASSQRPQGNCAACNSVPQKASSDALAAIGGSSHSRPRRQRNV